MSRDDRPHFRRVLRGHAHRICVSLAHRVEEGMPAVVVNVEVEMQRAGSAEVAAVPGVGPRPRSLKAIWPSDPLQA